MLQGCKRIRMLRGGSDSPAQVQRSEAGASERVDSGLIGCSRMMGPALGTPATS